MGYLVDSNVVIDYAAERFMANQLLKLDSIFDQQWNASVVTRIETLGFPAGEEDEDKMRLFLMSAVVIGLSEEIVVKTISIRKNTRIKVPDAIIAATALVHQLTLLTRNLADFHKLPGLKLENPQDW